MLMSIIMSDLGENSGERVKSDFIDVRRAYVHARARQPVLVRSPPGDAPPGKFGRLLKAMSGMRDAALNWEKDFVEFKKSFEISQWRANPSMFLMLREMSERSLIAMTLNSRPPHMSRGCRATPAA